MSYGSVVARNIEERKSREAKRQADVDRAKGLIRNHLPEFCSGGYVDGWAVRAALELKRDGKPFNAVAVRRRRNEMSVDGQSTVAAREKEGWQ